MLLNLKFAKLKFCLLVIRYQKLVADLMKSWKMILSVIEEYVNYYPRELVLVLDGEGIWNSPTEIGGGFDITITKATYGSDYCSPFHNKSKNLAYRYII